MQTEDGRDLEQLLWERLGTVIDPCMRLSGRDISVVDLGLINGVVIEGCQAFVSITMTDAFCANAHRVFLAIEALARDIPGLDGIAVVPRSFPLWTEDRMSECGRAAYRPAVATPGIDRSGWRGPPVQAG